jgi:hypothetical protein
MKTIYTIVKDAKSETGISIRQGQYGIFRDFHADDFPPYFNLLAENVRSGREDVEKFWWSKIK